MQYNHYDFVGKLVSTRKRQSSSANTAIPELLTYDYDQVGRLKSTTYQIKNQTPILLCSYRYDELGRRVTEYHHYKSDSVNYNYNIRSWTTRIKSGTFEENLYYQDITGLPSGSTQCYNGNICYQTWTYGTVNKGYQFDYDELNRLAASYFYKGSSTQADSDFNEEFAYDIMGNVTALRRYKDGVLIDDLTLYYNGNQLRRVLDAAGSQNLYSVKEYNATTNASSGDSQTYDANGNLISDYDRNIVAIRYNVLNLPDTIQFKSGNQIINRYNAAGVKLKTVYYTLTYPVVIPLGATTKWTYRDGYVTLSGTSYVDNVEYSLRSNDLAYDNGGKVYNEVGYSSGDASSSYFYYRKDHLGNVREVVSSSLAVLQRTQYYPSGLPWSEGLNPSTQERKYNGKEFIEMDGLDETDLGARGLHHAKFRFDGFDPLAEKHYDTSPYAVCSNNPVNRVDPDGMDWIYSNDDKKYSWRDDINAKSKMPKGYQYVGAKDNDILTHMGVSNKYETKTDNNTGIGAVGGDNKGPAGEGVPGTTSSDVKVDIRIDTNVSDNKKNITDNNKSGKTFNGVTVTAYVSERNASSSDDLASTSYGVFSVENVGIEYTKGLGKATGFIKSGTKATNSSIKIPASEITPTNYLRSATVTIGSPNAGVIYSSPTTITFNLQTRTYFRPSNK